MTGAPTGPIESVLREKRPFKSIKSPEKFWAKIAGEPVWFKKWGKVLSWNYPFAKWFIAGKTNISYDCLDRNLSGGKIMRRLLREIAAGSQTIGDVTTLEDFSVLEKLRAGEKE
jgi:ABC-type uncharacterized transport system YnjBCD substrate-binding protein